MLRHVVGTIVASVFLLACSDESLSGPEAQAAFIRARTSVNVSLGEGMLVVLDGVVVPSSDGLRQLDPQSIRSIEIVKGPAAHKRYGDAARNGAIYISTR